MYAMLHGLFKLEHLLGNRVHLVTDHDNFTEILGNNNGKSLNGVRYRRVVRWRSLISEFDYDIIVIKGKLNLYCDLLSRLFPEHGSNVAKLNALHLIDSSQDDGFDWPSVHEIKAIQRMHEKDDECKGLEVDYENIIRKEGKIWIPNDQALKVRIMIGSHAYAGGHRGIPSSIMALRKEFWWTNLEEDVTNFVKSCIHCLVSKNGTMIKRPLGNNLVAEKIMEVLHIDFLTMNVSAEYKYVLTMVDGFSNFIFGVPTKGTTAVEAVNALMQFITLFGIPEFIVSDAGPAFIADSMHQLERQLGYKHHIVVSYTHTANGKNERFNRVLLECMKAIMSETRTSGLEWINLLPVVLNALNSAPSKRLGGFCSKEVFLGLPPSSPITSMVKPQGSNIKEVSEIPNFQLHIQDAITVRENRQNQMAQVVAVLAKKKREENEKYVNKKARMIRMIPGDYCLVVNPKLKPKLCFQWEGPFQVVDLENEWVYKVRDMVSNKVSNVHISRIYPYNERMRLTDEAIKEQSAFLAKGFEISRIVDVARDNYGYKFEIEWFGFSPEFNSMEPARVIWQDAPIMVRNFIMQSNKVKLMKNLCTYLGVSYTDIKRNDF